MCFFICAVRFILSSRTFVSSPNASKFSLSSLQDIAWCLFRWDGLGVDGPPPFSEQAVQMKIVDATSSSTNPCLEDVGSEILPTLQVSEVPGSQYVASLVVTRTNSVGLPNAAGLLCLAGCLQSEPLCSAPKFFSTDHIVTFYYAFMIKLPSIFVFRQPQVLSDNFMTTTPQIPVVLDPNFPPFSDSGAAGGPSEDELLFSLFPASSAGPDVCLSVFDSMFGGVSVGQNIYLMSAANSIPLLGGAPGIHNVYVFVSAPTAVSFKPCFGLSGYNGAPMSPSTIKVGIIEALDQIVFDGTLPMDTLVHGRLSIIRHSSSLGSSSLEFFETIFFVDSSTAPCPGVPDSSSDVVGTVLEANYDYLHFAVDTTSMVSPPLWKACLGVNGTVVQFPFITDRDVSVVDVSAPPADTVVVVDVSRFAGVGSVESFVLARSSLLPTLVDNFLSEYLAVSEVFLLPVGMHCRLDSTSRMSEPIPVGEYTVCFGTVGSGQENRVPLGYSLWVVSSASVEVFPSTFVYQMYPSPLQVQLRNAPFLSAADVIKLCTDDSCSLMISHVAASALTQIDGDTWQFEMITVEFNPVTTFRVCVDYGGEIALRHCLGSIDQEFVSFPDPTMSATTDALHRSKVGGNRITLAGFGLSLVASSHLSLVPGCAASHGVAPSVSLTLDGTANFETELFLLVPQSDTIPMVSTPQEVYICVYSASDDLLGETPFPVAALSINATASPNYLRSIPGETLPFVSRQRPIVVPVVCIHTDTTAITLEMNGTVVTSNFPVSCSPSDASSIGGLVNGVVPNLPPGEHVVRIRDSQNPLTSFSMLVMVENPLVPSLSGLLSAVQLYGDLISIILQCQDNGNPVFSPAFLLDYLLSPSHTLSLSVSPASITCSSRGQTVSVQVRVPTEAVAGTNTYQMVLSSASDPSVQLPFGPPLSIAAPSILVPFPPKESVVPADATSLSLRFVCNRLSLTSVRVEVVQALWNDLQYERVRLRYGGTVIQTSRAPCVCTVDLSVENTVTVSFPKRFSSTGISLRNEDGSNLGLFVRVVDDSIPSQSYVGVSSPVRVLAPGVLPPAGAVNPSNPSGGTFNVTAEPAPSSTSESSESGFPAEYIALSVLVPLFLLALLFLIIFRRGRYWFSKVPDEPMGGESAVLMNSKAYRSLQQRGQKSKQGNFLTAFSGSPVDTNVQSLPHTHALPSSTPAVPSQQLRTTPPSSSSTSSMRWTGAPPGSFVPSSLGFPKATPASPATAEERRALAQRQEMEQELLRQSMMRLMARRMMNTSPVHVVTMGQGDDHDDATDRDADSSWS